MKVGDYVRTKNYGIKKILDIGEFLGMKQYLINEDGTYVIDNSIIKSSPNIMDLIEVGDIHRKRLYSYEKDDYYIFDERDIKSIVTKEQFESMEYKIGD